MTAILGDSTAHREQAHRWVQTRSPEWRWPVVIDLYWHIAPLVGVRADVAFAQACKETGFGRFGRAVTYEHRNPCGLKIPDPAGLPDNDSDAHQRFPTWEVGIQAHLEHLALYAGAPGFPRPYAKVDARRWQGATHDPRHFAYLWGKAQNTVEGLSGSWAPAADYGQSIVRDFLTPMTVA